MSNSRRFVAALLSLCLLQLSLPLGARACTMRHGAAAGVQAAGHDMSDMSDMSDMGGCELPSAPGQCESMTACAITALPTVALQVQRMQVMAAAELPEPATTDSRLASPPELPPPRA